MGLISSPHKLIGFCTLENGQFKHISAAPESLQRIHNVNTLVLEILVIVVEAIHIYYS